MNINNLFLDYNKMAVIFTRDVPDGLCSHLTVLCVIFNNTQYSEVGLEINMSNYKCNWTDLFDYKQVVTSNRRPLLNEFFSIKGVNFNRSNYTVKELKEWNSIWNTRIHIRSEIIADIQQLYTKYPFHEATCVYFRGTDKKNEVKRVNHEKYLKHIPEDGPLYVQSDESGFIDYIKSKYPKRAFTVENFNCSSNDKPVHWSDKATIDDAKQILAIIHLMAKSKKIIANISNVTQMALVIRGHNEGYTCIE
jgi:hypothetical protein